MQIYKDLFSRRFREARRRSGKKQREIAEALGVEPSTVSRWETGADLPDDSRLPVLCKTLNVPLDHFSRGEATSPPQQLVPDWLESARVLQQYLNASPDRRLLALYILSDDEQYLTQYEAIPDAPPIASVLKKIL